MNRCSMWLVALCVAVVSAAYGTAPGVSYTHYRFKVDAVHGSSAIGMQMSELALLCDGVPLGHGERQYGAER